MKLIEYRENTKRTCPDLGKPLIEKVLDNNTSKQGLEALNENSIKLNLSHMIMGLGSEIGELIECIGTDIKLDPDRVNLKEELGDLYWYLSNYCNMRDLPLPEEIKIDHKELDGIDLLITSVGTLTDQVKRFVAYNKEIVKAIELEATYDITQSLALIEDLYDLDGDEIRQRNIDKLRRRFPDKFTNELAINRDISNERSALTD